MVRLIGGLPVVRNNPESSRPGRPKGWEHIGSAMSCIIRVEGQMGAAGCNLESTMPGHELEKILARHGDILRLAAHLSYEKLAQSDRSAEMAATVLSPRETGFGARTREQALARAIASGLPVV